MPTEVKEVIITQDELTCIHLTMQDEIRRMADSRDWFVKHHVEIPEDVKYSETIENLLSICNRLTCMILEGVPFNDKKYVLRSVSRDYTRNPDE